MRETVLLVVLGLCLPAVHLQLVCYQCDDCEYQQEIPVVCGDPDYTTPNPTDTTCPTCEPEPTLPTTPELTTATPDTTCPTCEPTLPTTPMPTTSTPIPTTPVPETTCPTCAPTLPTTPVPTTATPETTCPTCEPTLPTTPMPTTSTPYPTTTSPAPTEPTTPPLTTSTPTVPTTWPPPECPPGCCPCFGSRSTSVFSMAARAAKATLMDEFENELRSARQLPLPVYVCYTMERIVNYRRVVSRGCTKRQQSLNDTCFQISGGQEYEQCGLCSWQLCNR